MTMKSYMIRSKMLHQIAFLAEIDESRNANTCIRIILRERTNINGIKSEIVRVARKGEIEG